MAHLARHGYVHVCRCAPAIHLENAVALQWVGSGIQIFYFEKIRVFKAGLCCEYISME
jgi:hypothetical protein